MSEKNQPRFYVAPRVALFFVLICAALATPTHARADLSVAIVETARMNWGTLAVPSSGTATVILHPTNGAPSGTGVLLYGMTSRGQYNLVLSGSGPETSMSIDISNITSGSGNFTLSAFTGIFDGVGIPSFPSGTLGLPVTTPGTPLYLGATATVNSGQSTGSFAPTFDIDLFLN